MAEKTEKAHSLSFADNVLVVNGVTQVVEISEKEAQLKLSKGTLIVKGTNLNVAKLDREEGVVRLETQGVQSLTYRQTGEGLKGLFR